MGLVFSTLRFFYFTAQQQQQLQRAAFDWRRYWRSPSRHTGS
jgi:hypothetical protein